MNVIGVGWADCSRVVLYEQAVECSKNVGGYIGELVLWLHDTTGLAPSNVHAIGHSLGGEAISFISRLVQIGHLTGNTKCNEKGWNWFWKVALDPARPLFSQADKDNRIDPSDADFVDVFHTSTGLLGVGIATGDVDFYPNGGVKQPGCSDILGEILVQGG